MQTCFFFYSYGEMQSCPSTFPCVAAPLRLEQMQTKISEANQRGAAPKCGRRATASKLEQISQWHSHYLMNGTQTGH